MTVPPPLDLNTFAVVDRSSLRGLLDLSSIQRESLARIARAHEEYVSGRCDANRLVEVVRQETARAAKTPRQARRRTRPVRG